MADVKLVLGREPDANGWLRGSAEWRGRALEVTVCPEDAEPDEAIAFARLILAAIGRHDEQARNGACSALLGVYNEGWRHYTTADAQGAAHEVSEPELSEAEFKARLQLTAVNTLGTQACDLFYSDDEMFWGHSVVVSTNDGGTTWSHAELFG
jgi:hypothetical protein